MAKATKPDPSKKPVEKASKAKVGPVTVKTIETGITKLKTALGHLQALQVTMKQEHLEEMVMEGPKLLPRGVNSVLQFGLKLENALRRRDRMS